MRPKPTTIAVIVPTGFSGGTMRSALNAAIQIHDGARSVGDPVEVELGYVDVGQTDFHVGFRELERRGVPYRAIEVEPSEPTLTDMLSDPSRPAVRHVVFNDRISNFDNSDYLLIVSDRVHGGVPAPSYRYGMIIHDFIQRYVPEILEGPDEEASAMNWRITTEMMKAYERAQAIFVSTEQARSDAIAFAGVPSRKVIKLPMAFDPIGATPSCSAGPPSRAGKYLVWTSNATAHKNHLRAFEALDRVYASDPDFPDVVMTGAETDALDISREDRVPPARPHVGKVREALRRSRYCKDRISFAGNVSDEDYLGILQGAALLFHPAVFDNGTFAVVEAAWFGVPSLSSRYPAIEEVAAAFGLAPLFFDALDPEDIARALREAQRDRDKLTACLPGRDKLAGRSRDARAVDFWLTLRAGLLNRCP